MSWEVMCQFGHEDAQGRQGPCRRLRASSPSPPGDFLSWDPGQVGAGECVAQMCAVVTTPGAAHRSVKPRLHVSPGVRGLILQDGCSASCNHFPPESGTAQAGPLPFPPHFLQAPSTSTLSLPTATPLCAGAPHSRCRGRATAGEGHRGSECFRSGAAPSEGSV